MNADLLDVPITYEEAFNGDAAPHWPTAMNEELSNVNNVGTWSLVPLPKNRGCVKTKRFYDL